MWWVGFNNALAPGVSTPPPGTYRALGYGGQAAIVLPALDLVIGHRALRFRDGGPPRDIARLIWLLLDVGGFPDIGPDASIMSAKGDRLEGEALNQRLASKTLLYGEGRVTDPIACVSISMVPLPYLREMKTTCWIPAPGTLRAIASAADFEKIEPRQGCWRARTSGSHISLFDRSGLMLIDARLAGD